MALSWLGSAPMLARFIRGVVYSTHTTTLFIRGGVAAQIAAHSTGGKIAGVSAINSLTAVIGTSNVSIAVHSTGGEIAGVSAINILTAVIAPARTAGNFDRRGRG